MGRPHCAPQADKVTGGQQKPRNLGLGQYLGGRIRRRGLSPLMGTSSHLAPEQGTGWLKVSRNKTGGLSRLRGAGSPLTGEFPAGSKRKGRALRPSQKDSPWALSHSHSSNP